VNVDNGVTTQHTLQADGRTMSGGCCTITRVGAAPPVLSSDSKQPSSKQQLPAGLTKDLHTKIDQGKSTRAANTAQPTAPPNPVYSKSASCSDITGTNSTAPAATDCKDAIADRDVARANRKKDPELSKFGYRKAAEAARRSGDIDLELSILREAETPSAADKPDADRDSNLQDAQTYLTAAKAGEENDPTCTGLTNAAENYLQSAKFFLRADQVKKTDELLLRHDALIALVDRAKQEGRCRSPVRETNIPPLKSEKLGDGLLTDACKQKLADIDKLLARPGSNMNSIGDESAGDDKAKAAPNVASIAVVAKVKLAAQGCRDPDAGPFSKLECRVASYDMRTQGIVGAEADAILEKANCR
jgi:hypothetical protein